MKLLLFFILLFPFHCFSQKVNVGGYLSTDSIHYNTTPARCSAHITSPSATTITSAGTYYFLKGIFHNDNIASFTNDGDTLVYSNGNGRRLYIAYDFTVTATNNSETVTIAIYRNNTIQDGSNSASFCKTAGDEYMISSNFIMQVNNGDKIKKW